MAWAKPPLELTESMNPTHDITETKTMSEQTSARIHKLRRLSELGMTLTGTPADIFRHAVGMIGEMFALRVVCLSQIVDGVLHFRAVYVNGEIFTDAGTCPITVTPCATVEDSKDLRVYDRVAERFPQASFLRDHQAQAYCGFPSLDAAGRVVAVTCLLDDKPREFSEEDQEILRIIGQRLAAEVERERHITERNQVEAELRVGEERLRQSVRCSQIGIFDHDHLSNMIYWSPEQRNIHGWSADEPVQLANFISPVHPEDRGRIAEAVRRAHDPAGDGFFDVEHRLIRRNDGAVRWLTTRSRTFFEGEGGDRHPVRTVGAVVDITDRKQAEAAQEEALGRLQKIASRVPGVVYQFRLRPDGKACFPYASDGIREIYRISPEEVRDDASKVFAVLHPEDYQGVVASIQQSAADMTPWQHDYRVKFDDGTEQWLSGNSLPEREADGSTLWHGFITDITERKRAEAELAKIQQDLVEASRRAGMAEVATGVLHNVGNVLNSVNISTTLIVEQLRKSKTVGLAKAVKLLGEHKNDLGAFLTNESKGKQLHSFLEALSEELTREQAALTKEAQGLQQNVEHIKQIVAMQQSYARVSGVLENLPLAELVEDALRMSSAALARHRIELVRQLDAVPAVQVDRHKVLQILVNLINNASHALDSRPEGRCLTLRIAQGEGDLVRVEITDNGMGIPKENLTRVFEHGFTTKKTGHGFGLHSGANAAKEMGGSLNVRSDGPGAGATFILELPTHKNTAARKAA